LTGKPVAIMGASTGRGGTARAQAHLRDGLAYTNGYVLPLPEVMVPLAADHFDAESELVDEEVRDEIRTLLRSLAAWTRRIQLMGPEEVAS
jgi:chromate reductase